MPRLRQYPEVVARYQTRADTTSLSCPSAHLYEGDVVDTLTPAERSQRMSLIRGKNTKPEMFVRQLIHGMGYRYRLHGADLPGKPDLVFRRWKGAIFVHGCFWHQHPDLSCKIARLPKSRAEFWEPKLARNRERDSAQVEALEKMGWKVLTIWECQLKEVLELKENIRRFLEAD
jgi:DNA mismatch endonuclease (patch repair protein)